MLSALRGRVHLQVVNAEAALEISNAASRL
jgi:hypothetical protein